MLQFIDSALHYTAAAGLGSKWTIGGPNVVSSPAPQSGNCLQLTGGPLMTLPHMGGWVVGFRLYVAGVVTQGEIYLGGHAGVTLVTIRQEIDGTLSLFAGNTSTLIGNTGTNSPVITIQSTAYYYIEIKYSIGGGSNMSITAELRVNGNIVISSASANSNVNENDLLLQTATVNTHIFRNAANDADSLIKDIYIADTSGSGLLNDYAGDVLNLCFFADSDVLDDWSTTGSPSYDQVNPNPPTYDASYVYSDTMAQQQIFGFQSIPGFTGTIPGIQLLGLVRKDAEGTRSFELQICDGGTTVLSSPSFYPGDSYLFYRMPLDTDPHTTIAWTQAGFNATQFGIEITS